MYSLYIWVCQMVRACIYTECSIVKWQLFTGPINNVNRVAWSPCSKIIIILKMWNCFSSTCCKYLQDLIQWSWSLERSFSFSKVQMETIFNKHLRQLLFSLTWMNQNNDRGNSENIFTCLMQLSIWSEANMLSIHQHNNNKKLCKVHNNHTFLEFPTIHHFHTFHLAPVSIVYKSWLAGVTYLISQENVNSIQSYPSFLLLNDK